jgi:hypothetical protein
MSRSRESNKRQYNDQRGWAEAVNQTRENITTKEDEHLFGRYIVSCLIHGFCSSCLVVILSLVWFTASAHPLWSLYCLLFDSRLLLILFGRYIVTCLIHGFCSSSWVVILSLVWFTASAHPLWSLFCLLFDSRLLLILSGRYIVTCLIHSFCSSSLVVILSLVCFTATI